jgi:hypothetical protein
MRAGSRRDAEGKKWALRGSPCNRQSPIANRQSPIANRRGGGMIQCVRSRPAGREGAENGTRGGRAPQATSGFGLVGGRIGRIGPMDCHRNRGPAGRQNTGVSFQARWAGLRDDGPLGLREGAKAGKLVQIPVKRRMATGDGGGWRHAQPLQLDPAVPAGFGGFFWTQTPR